MDGSHLADQLVLEGHEVFGMVRGQRQAVFGGPPEAPGHGVTVIRGDLTDQGSLYYVLDEVRPDMIFNLAAVTAIGLSWGQPALVADVNGIGVIRLLEAIRRMAPGAHLVQASTADQFGDAGVGGHEETPFKPRSPYACAKQMAHDAVQSYREAYQMHVSTAIMYNHSSERHGEEFVVQKTVTGAAMIRLGRQDKLKLGDLSIQRDWGYAPDYMRAWPLIAAQDRPGDYVLATGRLWTLGDLVARAFAAVDLDWHDHVVLDESFSRPADVGARCGNSARARETLGWEPEVSFEEMVKRMTEAALERLR